MHDNQHLFSRRDVLRLAGLAGLGMCAPNLFGSTGNSFLRAAPRTDKVFVLIELDGGNDGLNTVIPVNDSLYHEAREQYGMNITSNQALALDGVNDLRFHPRMTGMRDMYNDGDMAVILGVGYAEGNRSHFTGIENWNTGSDNINKQEGGWLGRLLTANKPDFPSTVVADGTLLYSNRSNPMQFDDMRVLSMQNAQNFIGAANELVVLDDETKARFAGNEALEHLLRMHENVTFALDSFNANLRVGGEYSPPTYTVDFPNERLGNQLKSVADMIISGISIPVHKVSLPGFDTHAGQISNATSNTTGDHANLLQSVSQAVTAFRAAMIEHGRWDDVLVMTYSEFGRRIEANASLGTDHGGASCHFFMGGEVSGGMYGNQPSLAEEDRYLGDLVANVDYRQMYMTAANFLGLDASPHFDDAYTAIDCLS